jgi:hypothetical protein
MKKAFRDFHRHILGPFLNDVFFPFIGFSALAIVSVFFSVFVVRLVWVVGRFAWNLI